MQNFNLHTHSVYSDGKSQPREIVEEAIRQELTTLGFSEHSPLPFDNTFSVKSADMPRYVAEIAQLKEEFKDKIDIYCGLEADYLTGVSEPFALTKEKYHLDYLIGGVHLVINPALRQAQGPEKIKVVEHVETPTQTINPDEIWFIDGPKWEVYDEGLQKFFDGDIRRAVRRPRNPRPYPRERLGDGNQHARHLQETLQRLLSFALADGGGLQNGCSRRHFSRRAPLQRNHPRI